MATPVVTSINCPQCRSSFTAPLQQIIDAQADPEAKMRLLSGQINLVLCPHCGFTGALNAPLIYHDAKLELALVYMPMELSMTDMQRQKAIGDLTNRLMQQLPAEARKGYLLQPQPFLSIKRLVDTILEHDTETREMLEMQRRKMQLFEQLRQIDPSDNLAVAQFVGANDDELDIAFFQLLDLMIGLFDSQGNVAERDRIIKHREALLEKSKMGQSFKAQQAAVEALAANPTHETLIDQLAATQDKEVRKALVAVGRRLLDYAFFQALTGKIDAAEAAGDTETQSKLTVLRKEVQEIRDRVDAITIAVMNQRASFLRDIMTADDPHAEIMDRLNEVDDAFFTVLNTNIQQAEANGRKELADALRAIGDVVLTVLNETAPPEIKLVGRLAAAESDDQVRQVLQEEREHLDAAFLEFVENAAEDMKEIKRLDSAERLRYAAQQIKAMIAA